MLTYQDFEKVRDNEKEKVLFIAKAINAHRASEDYILAGVADEYDKQKNTFITQFVKKWYEHEDTRDIVLCNNLFHRLNTQRCTYSLGNGISFSSDDKEKSEKIKKSLGADIDDIIYIGAYRALIHKVSYFFFNVGKVHNFTMREFVALRDEETDEIRAGIRFWQIDQSKPCFAVLYEEDGYTKYRGNSGFTDMVEVEPKKAYIIHTSTTEALGKRVTGTENYGKLPIVSMYGSRLEQSTLVGMKRKLDALDLIQSGFADNVANVQQIYWIIDNAGGMKDKDLRKFRDDLMKNKVATANTIADGVKITPYQNAVPTAAHESCIRELKASIYEDFGALDVHTIAAGATNDHIDAAYQPMDENADDFEYQVIGLVRNLLYFAGVPEEDSTPLFSRNRVSNQKETSDMVLSASQYLDDEAVLSHLPFITVDEKNEILERKAELDMERFGEEEDMDTTEEEADMDNKYLTEFSDDIVSQLEGLLSEE